MITPLLTAADVRLLDAGMRLVGAFWMGSIALSLTASDLALKQAEDALASFGLSEISFFGAPFSAPPDPLRRARRCRGGRIEAC